MKKIQEVLNLKGRRVLLRVDFNVPIGRDGVVNDSEASRLEKSLETIKHLQNAGAKTIVISHIGRDPKDSLRPAYDYLKKLVNIEFVPSWDRTQIAGIVSNMVEGTSIMLENLRQNPGEEKNDPKFAEWLSSLADMYVNDAFAVCHRTHASIVGITPYLPSYAGFELQKEIENLGKVMIAPERPFIFILGGAKFETKIPLLKKFENIADEILIGGALANNFFKTIGFKIGKSLVDKDADVSEFFNKENIKIPFDVVTKRGGRDFAQIEKDDIIVDLGEETVAEWSKIITSAKTVLWNGPLGLYEEGYDVGSKKLLQVLADSQAFSIVGGGDTVKLVEDLGLEQKISFVSTGGGAMLEFLALGTLPGIQVLE